MIKNKAIIGSMLGLFLFGVLTAGGAAMVNDASFVNETWNDFTGGVSSKTVSAGGDPANPISWFSNTGTAGAAPTVAGGEAFVSMEGATADHSMIFTGALGAYSSDLFSDQYIITMRVRVDQFPDANISAVSLAGKGILLLDVRRDFRMEVLVTPTDLWVNNGSSWTQIPLITTVGTDYTWQFEVNDVTGLVDVYRRESDASAFAQVGLDLPIRNQNVADQLIFIRVNHNPENTQAQGMVAADYFWVGRAAYVAPFSGFQGVSSNWTEDLNLYMALATNSTVTQLVGFNLTTGGGGVAPSLDLGELTVTMEGATNGQSRVFTGNLNDYVFRDATNYVVTTRMKVAQFPDTLPMTEGGPSNVGLNIVDIRGMDRVYIHLEPDSIWVQNRNGKWRKAADISTTEGVYYTWQFEVAQDPVGTLGTVDIFRRTSDLDAWTTVATQVEIGNLNAPDQWLMYPIFHNATNTQVQGIVVSDYLVVGQLFSGPVSWPYQEWMMSFELTEENGLLGQDIESDGMDNLLEYALGGNPHNDDATAILPTSEVRLASGTNWLEYVYNRRVDHGARGLEYRIETSDNLATGVWSTLNYSIAGIGPVAGGFESVTNRVMTETASQYFIRLKIQEN